MKKFDIEQMKHAQRLAEEINLAGGAEDFHKKLRDTADFAAKNVHLPNENIFNLAHRLQANHLIKPFDEEEFVKRFQIKYRLPEELIQFRTGLEAQLNVTNSLLKDFNDGLLRQIEFIDNVFSSFRDLQNQLQETARIWQERINSFNDFNVPNIQERFLAASVSWQLYTDVIAERINEIRLLDTHPLLSARLLEPGLVYSRYAENTAKRIEETKDNNEIKILGASLSLAQEQIELTADAVLEVITIPEDDDAQRLDANIFNSFSEQERDLLACGFIPVETTYQILVQHSTVAQIAEKARNCLSLVLYCNKAHRARGGTEDIFKPTTKFAESCVFLPFTIAVDQTTLQVVVEHLYFIIYEGAGKDKLRFVEKGFISTSEESFETVMNLKFLRNKWLSHDADHGKANDIAKTWRDLNRTLANLGFTKLPQTSREFTKLQMNLLDALESFLRLLADRINNQTLPT